MGRVKQPWPLFALKCLLVLALLVASGAWLSGRYRFGVVANVPCLPARLYLYRLTTEELSRGEQVVFKTDWRTSPHFKEGSTFVKLVKCLADDEVEIDDSCHVQCTGPDGGPIYESELEPGVLEIMGKSCSELAARYPIPPGSYFVVGTLPHAFDSRYWGLLNQDQVVGKVVWVLSGYDPESQEKDVERLRRIAKEKPLRENR